MTLGIPRLREIIMTASRELKTPTMSVPLLDSVSASEATKLTRSFTKLSLNELIAGSKGILVRETLVQSESGQWQRAYYVTLKFHPAERIKTAFGLSLKDIATVVAKSFVSALSHQMKLELRRSATEGEGITSVEGGEASNSIQMVGRDDEERATADSNKETTDLLGDDEEEDDESLEGTGIEDGAKENRKQEESYGGMDGDDDNEDSDDDDTSMENNEPTKEESEEHGSGVQSAPPSTILAASASSSDWV